MADSELARPDIALSVAIAGKRDLEGRSEEVEARLREVFGALARALADFRDSERAGQLGVRFDTATDARLTLVTGLADGADQVAAEAFLAVAPLQPTVQHLLGAMLPCGRDEFVANSAVADTSRFDELYDAAEFVIELDGRMPPRPDDAEEAADAREARRYAFEAQSTLLLRHADILIAVVASKAGGRVGGTQDSIRAARERAIPVVLVQLDGSVRILRSPRDFDRLPPILDDVPGGIAALVELLVGSGRPQDPPYVDKLLDDYFASEGPSDRRTTRIWRWFEGRFKPRDGAARSTGGPPQGLYRLRAAALARFYAGRYRGTILIGYALAVLAVGLAVAALVTMLWTPEAHEPARPAWIFVLVLAVLKLITLVTILIMIGRGNHDRLAHRAADYRYLSERLRSMIYLPLVGSMRPPPNPSRPYSTRVASEGVIDRLFDAVVRQMDPLTAMHPRDGKVVRPDAAAALDTVTRYWLNEQLTYHQGNQQTLAAMSASLEALARRLNFFVIAIVAVDLAMLLSTLVLSSAAFRDFAHGPFTLLLMSLAAILPAAVASLNGIRFQTECARLSDRSTQMSLELQRIETSFGQIASPVRLVDVLYLVEDISRLTLDEVAEWSGIYGKELVDP